jgi:hypothetical protein
MEPTAYVSNNPITLAETVVQFDVCGELIEMPSKALLRLSPSPRLVIECTDGLSTENIQLDVSRSPVTVSLFNTKIESFIVGRTVRVGEGSRISLTLLPKREPVTVHRTEERSSSVELSVLNFPKFFGGQDKRVQVGNEWRVLGSALLRVEGWEIEVSAVTTLHEIEKKLKAEGGYAITHTGTVKRLDGGDFAAQDVEPLLSALRWFLSFARGAFCGLTLVVGKDAKGQPAWEQWGTHRVTEWFDPPASWFDSMNGYILADAFPGFWKLFQEQERFVRTVVGLYLNANLGSHGVGYDLGLILTQAALERFSYRETGKAGERIAKALRNIGISEEALRISPEGCPELAVLGSRHGWKHGPHALVAMRNNLVHPLDKYGNVSSRAYYEASNLGQWYLELALLRKSGYEGKCGNRLTQEWVGTIEPLGRWLENVPSGQARS